MYGVPVMGFYLHEDQGRIECFPFDLDTSNRMETSEVGNPFVKMVDPVSGTVYDSEVYYSQMLEDYSRTMKESFTDGRPGKVKTIIQGDC